MYLSLDTYAIHMSIMHTLIISLPMFPTVLKTYKKHAKPFSLKRNSQKTFSKFPKSVIDTTDQ